MKKLSAVFDAKLTEAASVLQSVASDAFAATTAQLATWESELGLRGLGTESERRSALDYAMRVNGGQTRQSLQDVLNAHGFNVTVHGCWHSEYPNFVLRDPRYYADPPEYGTELCSSNLAYGQPQCTSEVSWNQSQTNGVVRGANYFDNITLQDTYLPPIPSDPAFWPFFLYVGGSPWGVDAQIDMSRYDELRRLCAKHRPLRHWVLFKVRGTPVPPAMSDTLIMDDPVDVMDNQLMD